MKRGMFFAMVLWVCVFTLPVAIFTMAGEDRDTEETLPPASLATLPQGTPPAKPAATTLPLPNKTAETVSILLRGEVVEMPIEQLVAAVTAAEMPALFPMEALKAQAVAIRTYIAYKMAVPGGTLYQGAVLCDDPAVCFAVADLDVLKEAWGDRGGEYIQRIVDAAAATKGQILTYENAPVLAVFHAMSGPKTEAAADVWGVDVAYLQSKTAPAGEAAMPRYEEKTSLLPEEFAAVFQKKYPAADLSGSPETWFSAVKRTESGMVKSLSVGGVSVSGMDFRFLCGLRSANFTVGVQGGRLIMETLGYGHGVGMSQHGAKAMAEAGENYEAILAYYYQDTTLRK